MLLTGGCLCRAVRYRITSAPLITRTCWCRVCQYIGAGSATVNMVVTAAALTLAGALGDYPCLADSGNHMHRHFCPTCGTHVYATADERPHLVVVRVGTLDDLEAARPELTIWAQSAPSWACLDEALPRVDGQPPPSA